MRGYIKNQKEAQLFYNKLSRALNPKHSLYKLAETIPWNEFEKTFSKQYSKRYGRHQVSRYGFGGITYYY